MTYFLHFFLTIPGILKKTNCHFVSKLFSVTNETMIEERRKVARAAAGSTDEQHFSRKPDDPSCRQPTSWRVLATRGMCARTECCIRLFPTRLSRHISTTGQQAAEKQNKGRAKLQVAFIHKRRENAKTWGVLFSEKRILLVKLAN